MGEARVIRADRQQLRWDMIDLDGLLPSDHRARIVWSFVESLDLTELYDRVRSREGAAGRPAADPAVLLALWLYATVEGVGSARELERLAESDIAYRWLAGGVPLNSHGLAAALSRQISIGDFRRGIRPSAAAIREQKQWSSNPPWGASRQYRFLPERSLTKRVGQSCGRSA